MKKLLLASLLILGFLQQGIAQRFDYDHSSNVFVGLNAGYVWHTSDVKNVKKRFPLGAGFTLGGTFNRDYGRFFTYDLRFRFLFGSWYGQDTDTTHAIKENFAVNKIYDTIGVTVQNFRAQQRSLDLEFAVHFNRVKERTGLDPYIFGGVGVTFTKTHGDLLKTENTFDEGTFYPYNVNPTGDLIAKDYTTPLDKNSAGDPYNGFQANFLPSLGVGIGYYFSTNFSVGLEHRTTFFRGDYFDGTHLNQEGQPSKIKNDWYHYTSIYFKWYLRKSENNRDRPTDVTPDPVVQNPITPTPPDNKPEVTPKPVRKNPPTVHFTNPSSSNLKTNNSSFTIRAEIKYVKSSENVIFTQNGVDHRTFIFNPNNNVFESKVDLKVGKNVFNLAGFNADGNDHDEVVIIYEREAPKDAFPPTVNIVDPVNSPFSVNQLNYVVKAAIHNIKARNQLTVTFNNTPFSNFSFNENGNINFSANLNLIAGVNTFKIVGTNNAGSAEDETVLIYTRKPTQNSGYPPTVLITTPNKNPFTTSKTNVLVVAKVEHIENAQQIEVIINGVNTTNFNYNANTKLVQFNVSPSSGYNNIRVKAKNPYGTDMGDMQIIYQQGYDPFGSNLPPLVSITTPSVNPYTTQNAVVTIIAKVEHVESEQQIEVTVNGIETTNFTFNKTTGNVQLNVNLLKESNIISIKGTNNFGSDSDITQIIYRQSKPTGNPPKVKIITPDKNPFTTYRTLEKVIATFENITLQNQIKVVINGVNASNFSFNNTTKQIQVNVNLLMGNNTVKVIATNDFGSASAETIIQRERVASPKPNVDIKLPPCKDPTLVFMTPAQSVTNVTNELFEVIAKLGNIKDRNQIEVFLNSRKMTDFSYDVSAGILKHSLHLNIGKSTYKIRLKNECSTKEGTITLNYEAPVCGVDITLDNADFCLSKPGGVIERDELLTNTGIQYNGEAKSLYFKAAENGYATVNGAIYPLTKGTYYHFMGILTVHLTRIHNQWNVCVESVRNPLFGSGASKPQYPCENGIESKGLEDPESPEEPVKPIIRPRPTETEKPTRGNPQDTNTEEPTAQPTVQPTRPAIRNDKKPRSPGGK